MYGEFSDLVALRHVPHTLFVILPFYGTSVCKYLYVDMLAQHGRIPPILICERMRKPC
ncbi:hypothetical protein EMIT07CA2_110082 [Brevibacillus sp. IT-7CA2]